MVVAGVQDHREGEEGLGKEEWLRKEGLKGEEMEDWEIKGVGMGVEVVDLAFCRLRLREPLFKNTQNYHRCIKKGG